MARSSRRAPPPPPPVPSLGHASGVSLAAALVPRSWQGVDYRPLEDAARVRSLFDFAAVSWPAGRTLAFGWGATGSEGGGEALVGALVTERADGAILFHGPVIIADRDPLEIAAQLVAAGLDHAVAAGAHTVFARPQSLDRIWIRYGFIPVPEGALPAALAGRTGGGLYAWRGGSALWSLRDPPSG